MMKKIIVIIISILILFSLSLDAQVLSIAQIQGGTAISPYNTQVVTIKGAVTGAYSPGYFIRDSEAAWSGMYVYDQVNKPALGDTVQVTATVDEYFTWTELKTITAYTLISTGNPIPLPVLLNTTDIDESWENCLVSVKNATCTKSPANLGNGEWELNDGSGPVRVNDLGYSYIPTTGDTYNVTGNVSFNFSFYKIEPRFAADVENAAIIFFTSDIYPSKIDKTSISLSWSTNIPGNTEVYWGTTLDVADGSLIEKTLTTEHSISIEGLIPGNFYYIKAQTVSDPDTCHTSPVLYSTASESSGKIRVCFNRAGIPPKEDDAAGIYTSSMIDTMIAYVNLAQTSLDIALYDFTNHASFSDERNLGLVIAINAAFQKGVVVRFITDNNVANQVLASLDPGIPILKVKTTAIMHDKFIVVDRENVSNAWLISGSTNPTYNNLVIDFNNLVAIQDQSIAKAYALEFNEMYGSAGAAPDTAKSLIGINKKDNTPHYFNVNGSRIELYFSPSDNTANRIISALNKAGSSIDFAVMAFTDDLLGNTLVNTKNQGLKVRGIIDYVEYSGSEYPKLLTAGVKVADYANPGGAGWPDAPTLHHKFAIVDAGTPQGTVITGSHNWTAAADSKNDENTLIIHDSDVANKYKSESQRIYQWLKPLQCNNDTFGALDESTVTIDILGNDILPDKFDFSITKNPVSGIVIVNPDFSISYTSMFDCICDIKDTLVYQICYPNDPDYCRQTTVFITLNVTKPFICSNDTVTGFDVNSLNFSVLDNDIIPQPFNLTIVRQPVNGIIYVLSDNSIYYEPTLCCDFKHIKDTIVYKLCNQEGPLTCSEATVFISMDFSDGINVSTSEPVKLWPNPVISDLQLSLSQPVSNIEILDVAGKSLRLFRPVKPEITIQMPGNKGVYFIRITMETGEIFIRKVVKL